MLFGDGHEDWRLFPSTATMEKWFEKPTPDPKVFWWQGFLDILVKYSCKTHHWHGIRWGQESYHRMVIYLNIYIAQK